MLEAIFQNPSQQVLSKYKFQVDQINALENKITLLTDLELREKTTELKQNRQKTS